MRSKAGIESPLLARPVRVHGLVRADAAEPGVAGWEADGRVRADAAEPDIVRGRPLLLRASIMRLSEAK